MNRSHRRQPRKEGPRAHPRALLPLPSDQRAQNLQALAGMIDPDALREVRTLLRLEVADWRRCYPPAPAYAAQAREVVVGCIGGYLRVALMPHPSPSTD